MRHRLGYRKLGRDTAARRALLRGLATQLLEHGILETTVDKARALRSVVEPLVTLAKVDSVVNRRRVASYLYSAPIVAKLFRQVGPANASRPGGYTRITKLGFRPGDHARRAVIELVDKGVPAAAAQ